MLLPVDTRQQTYHHDALTRTNSFLTHVCKDHVPHERLHIHHLEKKQETVYKKETCEMKATCETVTKESGSTETAPGKSTNHETGEPDRRASEEKYLPAKEEGNSTSKESDVDSGCGSSCHEICPVEPQITLAQLSISALSQCHAQKLNAIDKPKFLDRVSGVTAICSTDEIPSESKTEFCDGRDEEWSEFQKSEFADTFQELIKLAKDGMSTTARKRVDGSGKKNKITDYFQPLQNPCKTKEVMRNKEKSLDTISSITESVVSLNTSQTSTEVKCGASTSLCTYHANTKTEKERISDTEYMSDESVATVTSTCTKNISHDAANGNQFDRHVNKVFHRTNTLNEPDKPKRFEAKNATVIPTITLESETVGNLSEATREIYQDDSFCRQTQVVDNQPCLQDTSVIDTNTTSKNGDPPYQKAVSFEKNNHKRLRIQESLLTIGQIPEKADRPKSLVLPNEHKGNVKYGLTAPSVEPLKFLHAGQTIEQNGRMRSFSATIRRKLSFRDRSDPDDMDTEKHHQMEKKIKKLKGFRSFRKKKVKAALRNVEISHSTGHLPESKKYLSTVDKIFHENTENGMFSDVPFTIPEIPE